MTAQEKAEKPGLMLAVTEHVQGSSELNFRAKEGTAQSGNLGQEDKSSKSNSGVPPLALQVWR